MAFVWDEGKRKRVLREHGLDFADVCRVFRGPMIDDYDYAHSREEDRWRALGLLDGNVILVVYAERGDTIRLITARRATPEETQLFHEQFFGEPL